VKTGGGPLVHVRVANGVVPVVVVVPSMVSSLSFVGDVDFVAVVVGVDVVSNQSIIKGVGYNVYRLKYSL